MKRLEGFLGYVFLRLLSTIVSITPSRLRYALADALGEAAYLLARRYRRVALKNLRLAFGSEMSEGEIRRLARRNFRFLARALAEFLISPMVSEEEMRRRVSYRHGERLQKAVEAGKGVIIYTAHFGNWEWMGARIGLDYPLNALMRPADDPATNRLLIYLRSRNHARVIPTNEGRAVLRALRRGEVVGILADQNTAINPTFVDFFGVPAAAAAGPVVFAKRTGAPLVPAFIVCKGPGFYEIEFLEPVALVSDADPKKEIQENVARCARILEEQIRRHPDHWLWLHDRWRTRPNSNHPRVNYGAVHQN